MCFLVLCRVRLFVLALVLAGGSGCTMADQFATRATAYNIEIANARNQMLLLNILRAAHRMPMQFTDLTSAVGTATATGGIGSSLLVGPTLLASTGSNVSPNLSFAGGPTFTIASQNQREFYAGILAPIDKTLLRYYVGLGVSKELLYHILVAEIEIQPDAKNNAISIRPDPDDQTKWNDFQRAIQTLANAGLTLKDTEPEDFGPTLTAQSLSDPAKLAALAKEKIDLVPAGKGRFNAKVDPPGAAFCFDRKGRGATIDFLVEGRTVSVKIPNDSLCSSSGLAKKDGLTLGLKLRLRSVFGVLYFLGEISRSQLHLDETQQTTVAHQFACQGQSAGNQGSACQTMFSIQRGASPHAISVAFDGTTYSVPIDPSNQDHSAQIFTLVTQLLALSSPPKDSPLTPGVVTLIGH